MAEMQIHQIHDSDGNLIAKQVVNPGFPTGTPTEGATAAAGGNILTPGWANQVKYFEEDTVAGRCWVIPTNTYNTEVPYDQSWPWDDEGIIGGWTSEAGAISQSRPLVNKVTLGGKKCSTLIPVTEEMMDDQAAPATLAYVSRKAKWAIQHLIDSSIIAGGGGTAPTGFQSATYGITKSWATGTSSAEQFLVDALYPTKMTWIVNPTHLPKFYEGCVADLGSNSITYEGGQMYAAGRPVIVTHAAPSSQAGGISFAFLDAYMLAVRSEETAVSADLWFDYDTMAVRCTVRADGIPMIQEPTGESAFIYSALIS